jgi:stress response protein YsnF
MAEEVEVRKVVRPVEEIEVTKSQTQDTRSVEDTVRREEFDVDDNTKDR